MISIVEHLTEQIEVRYQTSCGVSNRLQAGSTWLQQKIIQSSQIHLEKEVCNQFTNESWLDKTSERVIFHDKLKAINHTRFSLPLQSVRFSLGVEDKCRQSPNKTNIKNVFDN